MIESRHLAEFLELAKQNSFRKAARKLNMSQPALSRSIQRLEEQLGVSLFYRSTQKVTLTSFGEALLPKAATIINSLGDARQVIEDLKGVGTGEFSVGFGPIYTDLIAARSIGAFSTRYPKVRIYTEIGRFADLIERLKNGQIDLFVGETSTFIPRKNYCIVPLKKRTGVYCCRAGHPIFKSKSIGYKLVARYPLVSCQLPSRMLRFIRISGDEVHTDKQTFIYSNIVCDSYPLAKQVCMHSDAVGIIPEDLISAELERGELRAIDFKHKPITSQSGIVYLATRDPSPAVKKFVEIVRELDERL